jgi:hypothetical protein
MLSVRLSAGELACAIGTTLAARMFSAKTLPLLGLPDCRLDPLRLFNPIVLSVGDAQCRPDGVIALRALREEQPPGRVQGHLAKESLVLGK